MFYTRLSNDAIAGEETIDMYPKYPQSTSGVALVHGAGSQADYCLASYGNQSGLTQMVGSVYPTIAGDNGGIATWGNPLSVTRLGTYLTRLGTRSNANKYALICASMGGLVALNYAAQATVKPACIVGVIPVINVDDVRANNRGSFAADINSAYGTYNESTMGANSNPYTMRAAAKLLGIPMLFFYGLSDAICMPSFTEGFAAADPTNRTLVSMSTGHEEASYINANRPQIMSFLGTYL